MKGLIPSTPLEWGRGCMCPHWYIPALVEASSLPWPGTLCSAQAIQQYRLALLFTAPEVPFGEHHHDDLT